LNRKTLAYWILIALVASLGLAAHAQTFSVIHLFDIQVEGAFPTAGVTLRPGALYGTTSEANQASNGSVYQITNLGRTLPTRPSFSFRATGLVGLCREAESSSDQTVICMEPR